QNVPWQNKLIETCAASLPDIIGLLEFQIEGNVELIEAAKNSTEFSEEEKAIVIASYEETLKDLNQNLELHKSILSIISSENKEEALKIISEHMDKISELHQEAAQEKEGTSSSETREEPSAKKKSDTYFPRGGEWRVNRM
ncbi:MAG: hypothetical protein HYY61_01240, partial [Deltaproteobacteria bacterium]|nr:hypothetical protein [Deltaproteobacteria bacterium]